MFSHHSVASLAAYISPSGKGLQDVCCVVSFRINEGKREAKEVPDYSSFHLAIRIGIGNLVTK